MSKNSMTNKSQQNKYKLKLTEFLKVFMNKLDKL